MVMLFFIMGLKIIVLGNMLVFNNPLDSVTYNGSLPAKYIERQINEKVVTTEEEEEITLYDKNDYFVRSPRFVEVVEKEDFKLDAPPKTMNKKKCLLF